MRIIILLLFLIFTAPPASAQSPASDSGVTEGKGLLDKLKQVEIFKDKIASKVSEIRTVQKAAVAGKIKSLSDKQLVISSQKGEKQASFSEDTVVFRLDGNIKKESKSSELKEGTYISVFGVFNEKKDTVLAKYIFVENPPVRIAGKIADLNKAEFTLTIKAREGDQLIDFEKNTTTSIYEKSNGTQKSGFSKFKIGDYVFIMATPNVKDENRYSALRIIQISVDITPTPTPVP